MAASMSPLRQQKQPAAAAPYRGPGAKSTPHDTNPCAVLSMHQPWASLLVYGIKRIEGRTWPTDHRGRYSSLPLIRKYFSQNRASC